MTTKHRETEENYGSRIVEDRRPWGKFRRFPHTNVSSIKVITVNPGGTLSLQSHEKRSEYWIILDDGLEVTLGERVWRPRPNDEISIPRGARHRLRNTGTDPARVMEVWIGDSDEADIVRFEDSYGRTG